MDAQLKKGLLDVCVLAVLRRGESYGYKIIADVAPYIEISESTLYPILKRLESSGAVTAHSREYNGRLRKYYAITEKGQRRILEFIEANPQRWVAGLREGSMLRLEGERLELIGNRPMRLFRKGVETFEVQPGDDLSFLL